MDPIRKVLPAEATEILDTLAEEGQRIMVIDRHNFKEVRSFERSLIPSGASAESVQRYLISVRMLDECGYITSIGLGDDLYKITTNGRRIAEEPRTTAEPSAYPRAADRT